MERRDTLVIKAIRTTYQTQVYRSKLEARWAHYLTELAIPFEYEPRLIDLGGGLRYLPDFYLPSYPAWLEIKGEIGTDANGCTIVAKCERLARVSSTPVILAFYSPLEQRCAAFLPDGFMTQAHFGMCKECGGLAVKWDGAALCPHNQNPPLTLQTERHYRKLIFDAAADANLWSQSPEQ